VLEVHELPPNGLIPWTASTWLSWAVAVLSGRHFAIRRPFVAAGHQAFTRWSGLIMVLASIHDSMSARR
jgi:hypothetical protein